MVSAKDSCKQNAVSVKRRKKLMRPGWLKEVLIEENLGEWVV